MNELSVDECEKYMWDEITHLDELGSEAKKNIDYFNRNVLIYSFLIQREWLAVRLEELAPLVGVSKKDLINGLHDVTRFFDRRTDVALRLHQNMEIAVGNVLNHPKLNYKLLEPVPHFGKITGCDFLEYINLLKEPVNMSFPSLVMNAFRAALPTVQMEMPYSEFPHIRLVEGQGFDEDWHFILGIFPHKGMLSNDEVNGIKGIISDIRDDLQSEYGNLQTLVVAPGVDDDGRASMGRNRHIHFLWGLSTLRFFHLYEQKRLHHKDYQQLLVAAFPAIFEAERHSTIFSIRDALVRLDKIIEEKKKEAKSE